MRKKENSKTSDRYRLVLNFTNTLDLERSNLSIYYSWKNIRRKSYNNNKIKIPDVTWNGNFKLTVEIHIRNSRLFQIYH